MERFQDAASRTPEAGVVPRAFVSWSRRHAWRLLLGALAIAVVLTAAWPMLEHETGDWLAQRVPPSWAHTASALVLEDLDKGPLTPSTLPEERRIALNTAFAALRMPSGETPPYELAFRSSRGFGARSFTLAGGQIIVTDELVRSVGNDRDVLSLLAVQLGHLQRRDALRAAVDKSPLHMLAAILRNDERTGIRLMRDAQPVFEHDKQCELEARQFADEVMRVNPA